MGKTTYQIETFRKSAQLKEVATEANDWLKKQDIIIEDITIETDPQMPAIIILYRKRKRGE